ncbi:MAG: serine/threonine protein kinase [Pirellulales bacterium]|nr:serine/threonine protein kinase [Pirellulales bacterium]
MTRLDVQRTGPAVPAGPTDQGQELVRAGTWELVRLAAEGPLARVYQARPVGALSQRSAAYCLKMLREEVLEDPRAVALIRREAQVGRTVAHPHLIPILAAHVTSPPYYVVMPWLEGQTLSESLAAGEPLDVPGALWVVRQAAEALAALHDAGWMHGDVKPANILVAPLGHVTLLDLGFARRPDETGFVADRCLVGTCSYIAPELLTSALAADIRSDLYSLGVVLFQILTGRLPFEADTVAELVEQHKRARPPSLRKMAPGVPAEVAELVRAMLSKHPLHRPQTPREVVRRLVELEIDSFGERSGRG